METKPGDQPDISSDGPVRPTVFEVNLPVHNGPLELLLEFPDHLN